MTEAALAKTCIARAKERGAAVVRITASSVSGQPDLVLCHRGRFAAAELKIAGRQPTKLQRHRLAAIRKAGGRAEVVRSRDDLDRLLDELEEHGV